MVDTNKLKAKIVENGSSVENIAKSIGVHSATLYRKLSDTSGSEFTISEIDKLIEVLNVNSPNEIARIFFAQVVA